MRKLVERMLKSLRRQAVALLIACAAAISLSACVAPKAVIEGNSPQSIAGNAIAQAEVALIKGYRLVADQAEAGVLFKSELQAVLAKLDQASKLVDEAKSLYDRGVFDGALNKVLDADKALDYVEAEIAKKLKDRRQPVSFSQPMSEAEAKQECQLDVLNFLVSFHAVKGVWTEEAIVGNVTGHPKVVAKAVAFIKADLRGDRKAAQAAMDAMYNACVFLRMNPEVKA